MRAARLHTVAELQQVVTFWCQRVEDEQLERGDERLGTHRSLSASRTFGGMVRVDGDLDPENGETPLAALNAVLDAEARSRTSDDGRTSTQRRADALGEICRQWLDRSDRPQVGASDRT